MSPSDCPGGLRPGADFPTVVADRCPLDTEAIEKYFRSLQMRICSALEGFETSARFVTDAWQRDAGGGGVTKVLSDGEVFEKAGVNFSMVSGATLPPSATAARPELAGRAFRAMGVSLVIHPRNPYVPTAHANVRFFVAEKPVAEKSVAEPVWWFGGGYDLTPYYGFDEDCRHWHETARGACSAFGEETYPRFKAWCDRYFYLRHRGEQRGIGGLFFDDLNEWPLETCFAFTRAVGDSFCPAYLPIVERRRGHAFGDRQRHFQLVRRGRYVEFNLVFDRGTLFGLQSGGRTESILMSLPPLVRWDYGFEPEQHSEEARLYSHYLKPQDWVVCK